MATQRTALQAQYDDGRTSGRWDRGWVAVAALLATLLLLTGCAGAAGDSGGPGGGDGVQYAADDPDCTAAAELPPLAGAANELLVVDRTASTADSTLPPRTRAALASAQQAQRNLTIVAVDGPGAPVTAVRTVPLDPYPGKQSVTARSGRAIVLACVTAWALSDATLPHTEGSDQLAALAFAGRQHPAELLVVSDGISSAPALDLASIGYDADPAATADSLAAAGVLPVLDGVPVVWTGLGETTTPLSEPGRKNLEQLWTAIVAASGAQLTLDSESGTDAGTRSTTDGLPADPLPEEQPLVLAGARSTCVRLPTALLFAPFSADVADPEALRGVADGLIGEPGQGAVVSGHTADYGPGDGVELATARADSVVAVLRSMGVPGSVPVQAIGWGSTRPLVDEWPGGVHDPVAAAQNRRVDIVYGPAGSVTADTACG